MSVVDATDVSRFRALVARELGLQFADDQLDLLAGVLERLCDAWGSGRGVDYVGWLASPMGWRAEWRSIAAAVTVGETYFFRNPEQFRALTETVVPERLRAPARPGRLRVLSAGCASGEEAYSIALALRESALPLTGVEVDIVGIDLNRLALEKARGGEYSSWSLRATPPQIAARYFRSHGRTAVLDDDIRAAVSFAERNLLAEDPGFWAPRSFDVIFCRNVMMYFSTDTMRAVVAQMATALVPGGTLFLGHAESLRGVETDFRLCHTHDTFYYQRHGATAAVARDAADIPDPPGGAAWAASIQRSTEQIASLLRGAPGAPGERPPAELTRAAHSAERKRLMTAATDLLRAERYAEASETLRSIPAAEHLDVDVQLLRAVLLIHGGDLPAAETLSREVLAVDARNAGAHYLLALCREQAGDARTAIDHNQTATSLDPGFAMPHLHLGLVARRTGDLSSARRELALAAELLQREDPARLLLFGGGFSREVLIDVCRAELSGRGGRA